MQKNFLTWFLIVFLIAAFSCSLNEALLSEKDLQSYYKLEITDNSAPITTAKALSAKNSLYCKLSVLPGGPAPAGIKITLQNIDKATSISYIIAKTGISVSDTSSIYYASSFPENLPAIPLPASLPDGYYTVSSTVFDAQNTQLAVFSTTLLIFSKPVPAFSIGMYPGTLETNEYVLFKLTAAPAIPDTAWILWKINDVTIKQSSLQNSGDRVVWQAPEDEGIYTVSALIYPFTPPMDQSIRPLTEVFLTASVKKSPIQEKFLPKAYYSIKLEPGYPAEQIENKTSTGNLVGTAIPEASGYSFGYILGTTGYVESNLFQITNILKDGVPVSIVVPFSLLNDNKASGTLFSIKDSAGNTKLAARFFDKNLEISTASTITIPFTLSKDNLLHFLITPESNRLVLEIYNNGTFIGSGLLENTFTESQTTYQVILAGPNGLSGIYYSFSIFNEYSSPLLFYSLNINNKKIISAGQFSHNDMQSRIVTRGEISRTNKSLIIPSDGSVSIPLELVKGNNQLSFEAGFEQGLLILYMDKKPLVSIASDGTIKPSTSDQSFSIGSLQTEKRIVFSVTSSSISITNPATGKSYTLTILPLYDFSISFSAVKSKLELFSYILTLER